MGRWAQRGVAARSRFISNGGVTAAGQRMKRFNCGQQPCERQGTRRPLRRILGEQTGDEFVEFRRRVGGQRRHPRWDRSSLLVDHLGQLRAPEGRRTRQHRIHHESQSVEIDSMIDQPAGRLFRRHVFSSAHDMAEGRMANPAKELGDPEVGQLHADFFGAIRRGLAPISSDTRLGYGSS